MKIPNFFKVREAVSGYSSFPLHHQHKSTTDFYRLQPALAREVVKGDKLSIKMESFVRLFPMPYPTDGRIKYYNRFFFVPNRLLMDGWNHFITQTPYPHFEGHVSISRVPYFTNDQICGLFSTLENGLAEVASHEFFYRKFEFDGVEYYLLCTSDGRARGYGYESSGHQYFAFFVYNKNYEYVGEPKAFWVRENYRTDSSSNRRIVEYIVANFGYENCGTCSTTTGSCELAETYSDIETTLQWDKVSDSRGGYLTFQTSQPPQEVFPSLVDFQTVIPDFVLNYSDTNITHFRFSNKGRIFYNTLLSLGYRVDFTSAEGHFTNNQPRSALKLLAYVKVYLDYYRPSQYIGLDRLELLFHGVESTGRWITSDELKDITNIIFSCYEHDYFTAAWDRPNGPNNALAQDNSVIALSDINGYGDGTANSKVTTRSTPVGFNGLYGGTAHIESGNPGNRDKYPANLTQYVIDALSKVQQFLHRNQLAGFRPIDRYLARYGVRLSDDRADRAYYLGSHEYSAMISDVMSTAETSEGQLGDYAGKGIAYSDNQREINFESPQEFGILIVISSVVPDIGYVQGVQRENMHLTPFDFFTPEFDNLGVQAIRNDELFADGGLYLPDSGRLGRCTYAPDGVFGFSPRYSEYKVGASLLTGDYAIPSRARGLSSHHLFRLFEDDTKRHDIDFCIGEQDQFDRVFNNTDSNYDHMNIYHIIDIRAQRQMKSIAEAIEFEDGGKELEVAADGTQLS